MGTLVSFAVLIAVVTLQVLGRFPGFPLFPWTEEVARFALVYLVAFSCGIALLRGELVNVDLFVGLLPARNSAEDRTPVDLIIIVFSVMIIPGAWDYVTGSVGERARSIDIPMIFDLRRHPDHSCRAGHLFARPPVRLGAARSPADPGEVV